MKNLPAALLLSGQVLVSLQVTQAGVGDGCTGCLAAGIAHQRRDVRHSVAAVGEEVERHDGHCRHHRRLVLVAII